MNKKKGFFATLGGWFKRAFFGGSNAMAAEKEHDPTQDYEEIVTPFKQIVRSFFERRIAVIAVCVVLAMFLLAFIGPLFMPKYYDSYTEVTQKNVPPTMSMLSVPAELKNDIKMIDSFGSFTVGLSNAGKVYVWGATQLGTTGLDMKDIPQEIRDAKIEYVAAGIDHAVAIDENGKVYCWGYGKLGQFGYFDPAEYPNILTEPDELLNGTIDVANIKKVTCGYQCSAILMKDGSFYLWGNKNVYQNIENFAALEKIQDIDFALNFVVGITDGNSIYTGKRGLYDQYRGNIGEKAIPAKQFLNGRKIVAISTTSTNVCGELDDGSLFFTGDFASNSVPMPALHEGERFVSICSGTYHYTGLTSEGRVLSWGGNVLDQCELPKDLSGTSRIYAGAFQSYAVNDNNQLVGKWGLKGYLFGTDTYGANIFHRIIQGGKMTMTIGAVAVIISTIRLSLRLLRRQGRPAADALDRDRIGHPVPALRADSFSYTCPDRYQREQKDLYPDGHSRRADMAGPGAYGPRPGSGGPRERIRYRGQGDGREGRRDRLQAHPAEHHFHHSRLADA